MDVYRIEVHMSDRRVFVFRVDYDDRYDFIKEELRQGRLRQGWGPAPLLGADGEPDAEAFARGLMAAWPDSSEDPFRRFNILAPMLDMKQGDLLVIPRMPDLWSGTFTIVELTGPYRFEFPAALDEQDFGHIIPINTSRVLEVGYGDSLEAQIVSGKFRSYQRAVNNAWHEGFGAAVATLWEGGAVSAPASSDWTSDLRDRLLTDARVKIAGLKWHAIEQLVERAFNVAGYETLRRNQWDGRGGDADLVFRHTLPLLSEVDGEGLKVFVQVKHKDDVDVNDREGIEQLDRITDGEPYALKVLFSTADSFTESTAELAQEKEVVLICGSRAMAFLARGLTAALPIGS